MKLERYYFALAILTAMSMFRLATPTSVQLLQGSGTTNPSKVIWKMFETLEERAPVPLLLTYRAVGSGTGQFEFIGADNDYTSFTHFGAGDIPFNAEDYQEALQGGNVEQIPFALGAISFFFNIPGVETEHLFLTPCILSGIFQAQITMWDDESILAINPELAEILNGQPITVFRRVHGSSSTASIAAYLSGATEGDDECGYPWTIGVGKGGADDDGNPDTAPFWPEGTTKAEGSDNMADGIESTDFSIGYIDSGHGHRVLLDEIELLNAAGFYLSSREADVGGAANFADLPESNEDWSDVNLLNKDGETTWPITAITYFYVREDLSAVDAQSAALLKGFLQFALSEEGQDMMENPQFGFVGLPQTLLDVSGRAVDRLVLPEDTIEWIFESSATTLKGTGTGEHVFSGKRREYESYELDTHDDTLAELAGRLEVLEASVLLLIDEMQSTDIIFPTGDDFLSMDDDSFVERLFDTDDEKEMNNGDIALIIAIIALGVSVICCVLLIVVFMKMNSMEVAHSKGP